MYYQLTLVLQRTERLPALLRRLRQLGVGGATIFETEGMEHYLRRAAHPFGAALGDLANIPFNKTVLVVLSEEQLDPVTEAITELLDSFKRPYTGFLFVQPVVLARGGRLSFDARKAAEAGGGPV
jgi:nitrogen regulatory protein PII